MMKNHTRHFLPTPLSPDNCKQVAGGRSAANLLLPNPVRRIRRSMARGWIPAPVPMPGIT